MTRKLVAMLGAIVLLATTVAPGVARVSQAVPAGSADRVAAAPIDATDESKVPHYFGPYPNWANSPLTTADARVVITGNGTGATATATVGANGAVTGITVTNGGHDYTNAKADIVGSGTGATTDVTIVKKGAVIGVTPNSPGAGYTAPVVTFSGGRGAAATAYGGVDQVEVVDGGSGYTFPTVDFDLPDAPDGVQATGHATMNAGGTITAVVVDDSGSGYSFAPGVAIHDGTLFDPIAGATPAEASTTLSILSIVVDDPGSGYNSVPDVTIADPTGDGAGATATAALDNGVISEITLKDPGSGYVTSGGIRKFVDTLPGLGPDAANNLLQYIPVAVPDTETFSGADYYEIAVVEWTEKMHSDLPATRLRGYVQLDTAFIPGAGVPLTAPDGVTPILMPDGITQAVGVDKPHFLGPTIVAQKDRAVRITFYNLLPTGAAGDLFLPVDSTIMGSGEGDETMDYDPLPESGGTVMDEARNPACNEDPKPPTCFKDNRATLHLHGGNSPWISDGTPHQWITPADENAAWPEGVSVQSVPDMIGADAVAKDIPDCSEPDDGCQTFYYTNQQSARLMFYHDHSWGITRLNVYAGEAAGYVITDDTEKQLMAPGGALADVGLGIPLIIQDRTFVPSNAQLMLQDPTWDSARWGGKGNFWYHHVYMPAQNPGDPSGMSAYGRWMYGPWFWPPAGDAKHGPIANPYYNKDPNNWTNDLAEPCSLDDPTTWQYDTDPFCEPELIPGTPNISVGMEQFNDTPIVNGTAYPTVTLDPKAYRLRMLNAANDRFFNFQWYVADAATASTALNGLDEVIGGTEVAFKADELAAAQLDPVIFPTPDITRSPAGPDWIQIGSESGFLPKPVVVDGQQVTTWITDPTRFDVGNVDKHSLVLAPAERADVVVDFSKFAGQTLILYNDAPAAYPARIPSYDYYTGAPDLSPVGAPTILPGYGPNTRTVMQVKIAANPAAPTFNLSKLQTAFSHKANGSGVFESGQHPIVVGQAAYNSAYGTSFASSGYCSTPGATIKCDGYARISQQGGDPFTFDTLRMKPDGSYPAGYGKVSINLEPKAIHDEMNSATFDEFGRMQALLGVEVVPASPGLQNIVLLPFVYSATELVDTTNLPKADVKVTPIATGDDGTQIWKITHNGVDTHPIHFHAADVQVLNRVTWDNIIIPPDAEELGWKETVRVSPLEDTIVAMRPVIPNLPFDFPNSIRPMSPMMPTCAEAPCDPTTAIDLSSFKDAQVPPMGMTAFAPSGDPIDVYNHYINYGAEYVYHCHILSHEEMDMMRSVLYAFPPVAPGDLTFTDNLDGSATLTWTDNSRSETAFVLEKSSNGGASWSDVGRITRLLIPGAGSTTGGVETLADPSYAPGDTYRVSAVNTVGDTWDYSDPNINEILSGGFPTVTTKSTYAYVLPVTPPAAPSNLAAAIVSGPPPQVVLTWTDNATDETGFVIERSVNGGPWVGLGGSLPANTVNYIDTSVSAGVLYAYQVAATGGGGQSAYSNTASADLTTSPPLAPTNLAAEVLSATQVALTWTDNATTETAYWVERSADVGVNWTLLANDLAADTLSYTDTTAVVGNTYLYRVAAMNGAGPSWSVQVSISVNVPPAPTSLSATNISRTGFTLNWVLTVIDPPDGFEVQVSTNTSFTNIVQQFPDVAADEFSLVISGLTKNTRYYIRIRAFNAVGPGTWSTTLNVRTAK